MAENITNLTAEFQEDVGSWWIQLLDRLFSSEEEPIVELARQAGKDGKLDFIKDLINKHPDLFSDIVIGGFMNAAQAGHLELVKYLLPKLHTIFQKNDIDNTVEKVLNLFLPSLTEGEVIGDTISNTASYGHVEVIKYLLPHLPAEHYDNIIKPAFFNAVGVNWEIIELLLPKLPTEQKNDIIEQAIIYAVRWGNKRNFAEKLLEELPSDQREGIVEATIVETINTYFSEAWFRNHITLKKLLSDISTSTALNKGLKKLLAADAFANLGGSINQEIKTVLKDLSAMSKANTEPEQPEFSYKPSNAEAQQDLAQLEELAEQALYHQEEL